MLFCESLCRLRETIPLRTALVKIRAHSWLKKNTSRYAQIRGDFSVYSVYCFPSQVRTATFSSVWKLLHADTAELRRRFAKLCAFAWDMLRRFLDRRTEEHILFSHRTHGMTQNWLHVFTRIYTENVSRKGAKGAERYVLLFLCQTQNSVSFCASGCHV